MRFSTLKISQSHKEIDTIRLKIYEKTKGMNAEEYTIYILHSFPPFLKKYNIQSVSRIVEQKPNPVNKKTG
jgi:hypothetical protein